MKQYILFMKHRVNSDWIQWNRLETQLLLYCIKSPRRSLALDPEPGRLPVTTTHTPGLCVCVCFCGCVQTSMCGSLVLEPQETYQPISCNRAKHETLRQWWDPAVSVLEGMWATSVFDHNTLLLKPLEQSLEAVYLSGRRSLDCVQTLLSGQHRGGDFSGRFCQVLCWNLTWPHLRLVWISQLLLGGRICLVCIPK